MRTRTPYFAWLICSFHDVIRYIAWGRPAPGKRPAIRRGARGAVNMARALLTERLDALPVDNSKPPV